MALLSLCIPTYNRAEILNKSLESIVSQNIFTDTNKIEVVISDNASSDNTKEIAEKYIAKYGDKIRYFCNIENVEDKNFILALERGRGDFLKLCNDTLLWLTNSLQLITDAVENNFTTKPVLFFINQNKEEIIDCDTLNKFVKNASFMITWIGGFGLWKEDKYILNYMKKQTETKLSQTGALLQLVSKKKKTKIFRQSFCDLMRPSLSGNYNLSEVFIKNYLSFYEPYLISGELDKNVYNKEIWLVLKKHVLPRQFNVKQKFTYDKTDFWKYTKDYHQNPKFYFLILKYFIKKIKNSIFSYFKSES